jgi:hypothetical protein
MLISLTPLSVGLDRIVGGLSDRVLTAAMEREQRRHKRKPTAEVTHETLLATVHSNPKAQLDPQELAQATKAGLVERSDSETRITPLGEYVLGADPVE